MSVSGRLESSTCTPSPLLLMYQPALMKDDHTWRLLHVLFVASYSQREMWNKKRQAAGDSSQEERTGNTVCRRPTVSALNLLVFTCGLGEVYHWAFTLSFPRVINFKLPLQPHQKYYITQYGELAFSSRTQMKDDHTTTVFFESLGERTFWTWEWKG